MPNQRPREFGSPVIPIESPIEAPKFQVGVKWVHDKVQLELDGKKLPELSERDSKWLVYLLREAVDSVTDFDKTVEQLRVRRKQDANILLSVGHVRRIELNPSQCVHLVERIERRNTNSPDSQFNASALTINGKRLPTLDRAEKLWLRHLLLEAKESSDGYERKIFEIRVARIPLGMFSLSIGKEFSAQFDINECLRLTSAIDDSGSSETKSRPKSIASGIEASIGEAIATAIKGLSFQTDDAERRNLRASALAHNLEDWRSWLVLKVTGVGALTGAIPGGVGIFLEGLDIAYLFAACGQACYGIGHILGREVDYDRDIPLILAVWANAGQATVVAGMGKVAIKFGGKAAATIAAKSAAKVGSKLLVKASGKVAGKLVAKFGAKFAAGFVPFAGIAISGGINYWIATSLLDAAEKYYRSNCVSLDGTEEDWLEDTVDDGLDIVQELASDN